jgi:tetratricopeptide (TPR) repeat protein
MSVTYYQLAKKYNDWQSVRGGYRQLAESQWPSANWQNGTGRNTSWQSDRDPYRQMASLYYKQNVLEALNYYQKAIDIYETQKDSFYTEDAFQLNPNVCRRYAGTLFICYKSIMTIYFVLKN